MSDTLSENGSPLSLFDPLIAEWFYKRVGVPTEIQSMAWPVIAGGRHILVSSPTGSGKTMTAFLWAINSLVTGRLKTGSVRILYISPLKALNNDIRRNLELPLAELDGYFRDRGKEFPPIRVLARSGDTEQSERQRMLRNPPEILITTPESLNIMLSSKNGSRILGSVAAVIMDEVHALIGGKRGTHMITAVDRLVRSAGEFQRIALSATIRPMKSAADFIGGCRITADGEIAIYEKRDVTIIESAKAKRYSISVKSPAVHERDSREETAWPELAREFIDIISGSRSTLLFTNSRRLCEKVARLVNEEAGENLVYPHHSSLSREIRLIVEERLKKGLLRGIVATSSLELGIDIGDLDRVILVQSPPSISSAVQRIGRSGHRVGEVSCGVLYPTHGRDFIDAAVIAESIAGRDIEDILPVDSPLDVLAQVILSMSLTESFEAGELYRFIRASYPYRNLQERHFRSVLNMLAGKYAGTMIRELDPKISIDPVDNTLRARKGAAMLVYLSGGTIPDRGYFDMRLHDTKAKAGELDEEFVWERKEGDTFALGVQVWKIVRITHNDVEVIPIRGKPGMIPFWKAEGRNRDFHFSDKIGKFLEHADLHAGTPEFISELMVKYFMEEMSARRLAGFLLRQKEQTGKPLPHRHHVLIEQYHDPENRSGAMQVVIHTMWGGKVNHPFALALSAAWEKRYGYRLETFVNNDSILLILPHEIRGNMIFPILSSEDMEALIREKLESSGFFGARFRENAGRALLLPRGWFRKRMPLWLNRLKSQKLLDAVSRYDDFPILLETWRTCLRDEFDLDHLKMVLDEIASGIISVSETVTAFPSPFAGELIYREINKYMYEDDTPRSSGKSSLRSDLIREVSSRADLRPLIPDRIIKRFQEKAMRTAPGYSPGTSVEILDWIKDRYMIPADEWDRLMESAARDHGLSPVQVAHEISSRALYIRLPGAKIECICAIENIHSLAAALGIEVTGISVRPLGGVPELTAGVLRDMVMDISARMLQRVDDGESPGIEDILIQWVSYYGPVDIAAVWDMFPVKPGDRESITGSFEESGEVITGAISGTPGSMEICTRENLEIMLRMLRKENRPQFEALPLGSLPAFIAFFQGIVPVEPPRENQGAFGRESLISMDRLRERMDQLFGYPAPAEAWEEFIMPARMENYYTLWLDSLIQNSGLAWYGCGAKKISFALFDELDIFMDAGGPTMGLNSGVPLEAGEVSLLFPDSKGRYRLHDLAMHRGTSLDDTTEKLWELSWSGQVSCDSFTPVRRCIIQGFAPLHGDSGIKAAGGRLTGRWKSPGEPAGNWYILPGPGGNGPLEAEERLRQRVRQLFRRYGILFREILQLENSGTGWPLIFRALRLMELSGEILSGHFFSGISGLQFMSHEGFRSLNELEIHDRIFWINAADPASLCGTGIDGFKGILPARVPSTFIVFKGTGLVLTARRMGRKLDFMVGNDDPDIKKYLLFFRHLQKRDFNPAGTVVIEEINGMPASESPYAGQLMEFGFIKNYRELHLFKTY